MVYKSSSLTGTSSGSGGGGGGIQSINADTTAAQIITAGAGINVSTAGGTTTITNTSAGSAGVSSVFGRTGVVTAQYGDYNFNQIAGVAAVSQGGTGQTSLTAHAVLLGEGAVTGIGFATTGNPARILIDQGGADPSFQLLTGDSSLTSNGVMVNLAVHGVSYPASPSTNTVPVVTGSNTITYETVPNIALANSAITIGAQTGLAGGGTVALGSAITLSMGTNIANTLAGYNSSGVFSDVSIGSNLSLSGGILNGTVSSSPVTSVFGRTGAITAQWNDYNFNLIGGTATASQGGTGLSTLTAHAVMLGEGISAISFATTGTAGRFLIDQGVADPVFQPASGDVSVISTGAHTVLAVHGVSYPASPSTNTVPVVTSSNIVTYETVPNAALANSSVTVSGVSGITGGGIVTLGAAITLGMANNLANTLAGYNSSGVFSDVAIGSNLSLVGGTLVATAGSGAVSSVFGRTGVVAAQYGDYAFNLISGTAAVSQGGTGQISLTAHSVLLGEGAITGVGFATTGIAARILIDQGIADPTFQILTGDSSLTSTGVIVNLAVHGVTYPASPSTNTVPVVTSSNVVTYETVPNAALSNSSVTVNGVSGITGGGTVALGSAITLGMANNIANTLAGYNSSGVFSDISIASNLQFSSTTLDLANSVNISGSYTGASFIPNGSTAPVNGMYLNATNSLGFSTNSIARAFVNSSGTLSVGNANIGSVEAGGTVFPRIYSVSTATNASSIAIQNFTNGTGGSQFYLTKSRSAGYNAFNLVSSGDNIGTLLFNGADGTVFQTSASILSAVDASPSAGIIPGRISFNTTNTSGALNEALRIDSAQNIVIGTAALAASATNGFLYTPSCPGIPSGTPTSYSGRIPLLYDSSDNRLYAYNSGWQNLTSSGSGGAVSSVFGRTGAVVAIVGDYGFSLISGTAAVSQGGTGATSFTAHSVLLGEGSSAVSAATTGISGRLLIDQGSGNDPLFKSISGDISITNTGAASIISSVALTGNPTAVTQAAGDNSTRIATDAFVTTAINNAIAGVNPAVAVQFATTLASDTSAYTYNNGAAGIGATLTGANNVAFTADGQTATALLQRILVKNDTQSPSGAFNGVYYLSQLQTAILPPILTRALDYDQSSDINNTGAIPVVNGTVNADTSWLLTSTVTTVGTDPLTYVRFTINPTTIITTSTTAGGGLTGTYPNPALANPSATSLGGVTSIAAITHNFLISLSTSGAFTQSQPAFTDLSGSAATAQLPANQTKREVSFALDGQGSAIAAISGSNTWYLAQVPYGGTITGWSLVADKSGSIDIDVWKANAAVPTISNTITASAQCSLATAQSIFNGPITGWTSAVSPGDCFGFNLISAATLTKANLTLQITAS